MKEKILQLLRAKFQGTHNNVLDRVPDHLSQTVKEESQLETAIAGVEPLVTSFAKILQSEADRRVDDATKTAVENFRKKHNLDENGKPIQTPQPTTQPGGGEDVPTWAKGLMETVTKLAGTVDTVTKQTSQAAKLSDAKGKLKGKGVLDKHLDAFAGRINLDAENLDEEAERVSKEYTSFRQDFINEEVSKVNYTPATGGDSEDAIVDKINSWGKQFESK